jgi:hypothetical protein
VHPLVFGFIQQSANPTLITFHATQSAQMLQGASNHARDSGNRFKYNRAVTVAAGKKSISEEARRLGESKRKLIRKTIWCVVLFQQHFSRH